jgi:death on curing protein
MPSKYACLGALQDWQMRIFWGSAVMQPQNTHFYGGNPSLFDLAAEYAFSLGKNHAFHDGNKRVAAAAAIAFLDVNGWSLRKI